MNRLQIKICGVTNVEDARGCAELGADMIGLNFYPKSARYIRPQQAREIIEAMPCGVRAIGVFVDPTASEVRAMAMAAGIECVQLHGNVPPETCRELATDFRAIEHFSTAERFEPE